MQQEIIKCPKCQGENILVVKKGNKVIVKCGACKEENKD